MTKFCDGIRHLYLRGLNEVTTDIKFGLNTWLAEGKEYFVTQDQLDNDFTVATFQLNDFLRPYAYDINRLSCASIESLNSIFHGPNTPKFLGWNITKYYYSAFFSAHSILKITGNSVSNIDQPSLNRVRVLSTTRGYTVGNFNSGVHCIDVNLTNRTFRFYKVPQYADSHRGLWLKFLHFLSHAKASVFGKVLQADAQLISDKIDELIDALNYNSPNGFWLSSIRNSVNYSQNYGVWYPYKNYNSELDEIKNLQYLYKIEPSEIDIKTYRGRDLLYFVRTCQLINSINFSLQSDLKNKHSTNKSFLLHGIFEYQNKYIK